jgi:hypothetical protein
MSAAAAPATAATGRAVAPARSSHGGIRLFGEEVIESFASGRAFLEVIAAATIPTPGSNG